MERPQQKSRGGGNPSQNPPVRQSYWRFLAEKLLQEDQHSTATNPFKAKPSPVPIQFACTTHRVREIVADNHTGHCTSSTSSASDFLLSPKGRAPPMTKEQRRWSPSSCESAVETAKTSCHHVGPYATLMDLRWKSNSTRDDLHASFGLDGSERSTVSTTGSVDVSPRRPRRSMAICDSSVLGQ